MSTYTAELLWERGEQDSASNRYSRRHQWRFDSGAKVRYSGAKLPSRDELDALHHKTHEECYIANSVKTEVVIEAVA